MRDAFRTGRRSPSCSGRRLATRSEPRRRTAETGRTAHSPTLRVGSVTPLTGSEPERRAALRRDPPTRRPTTTRRPLGLAAAGR